MPPKLSFDLIDQNLIQESIQVSNHSALPERVLQFGTGNFLRGYADWMIDKLNSSNLFNGRIVLVQSSESSKANELNAQDGCYTVIERDQTGEKHHLITSVSRVLIAHQQWEDLLSLVESKDLSVILSNTTEAGITYKKEVFEEHKCPDSFPAKLTQLLYHRYKTCGFEAGLVICPMELIEDNGDALKKIIHQHSEDWNLEIDFLDYIENKCEFCNTLVDRIVSGYPKQEDEKYFEQLGYEDNSMVVIEPYHQLVIENHKQFKEILPVHELNLNVQYTDHLKPYRDAKVSFLNGAHTSMCLLSFLYGCHTVYDMMKESSLNELLNHILKNEIHPCVDLTIDERDAYIEATLKRFLNPYLNHQLLDISLNSVSKWKVRVLPTLKKYIELHGQLPQGLCFSLSALLLFYKQEFKFDDRPYEPRDNAEVMTVFNENKLNEQGIINILSSKTLWGIDLTSIKNLSSTILFQIEQCKSKGINEVVMNQLFKI